MAGLVEGGEPQKPTQPDYAGLSADYVHDSCYFWYLSGYTVFPRNGGYDNQDVRWLRAAKSWLAMLYYYQAQKADGKSVEAYAPTPQPDNPVELMPKLVLSHARSING